MSRFWQPVRPRAAQGVAVLRLDAAALARQRRRNRLQSVLYILGLGALAGLTGWVVAGPDGLVTAGLAALVAMLFSPAPGDPLFRRAFGAIPLGPGQAPELHALLRELARRAGLPRAPTLHLIPSNSLQAMAAGDREASTVAVTLGLLRHLPPREVAAVLAHEVAHIRHGDLTVMRLAATAASLTRLMAVLGLLLLGSWLPMVLLTGEGVAPAAIPLLIVAPLLGDLLTFSLSRQREFLADAGAVDLTGDPLALSSALGRIHRLQGDDWERLLGRGGPTWLRWLRTHPDVAQRQRRLAEMVAVVPGGLLAPDWEEMGAARFDPLLRPHVGQAIARRWFL